MDTTKEYIEMSRKAVEIQKTWEPRWGDFYTSTDDYMYDIVSFGGINFDHKEYNKTEIKAVWLPKQDQLQEMLEDFNIYRTTQQFRNWVIDNAFRQPTKWSSMEQLWLAFVMRERWGKKWSGTDWI